MPARCTIEDVEALAGYEVALADEPRVQRLIEMASGVVESATAPLPPVTPGVVRTVTAQLVVRQMANPTQASSEAVGAWRTSYGPAGMALTEADRALLGSWGLPSVAVGAYSVFTPSPYAYDGGVGFIDFSRDDAVIVQMPPGEP